MPETLQEIDVQLDLAALGVADRVKERQTQTGIKDPIAQIWIDQLILRGRELDRAYKYDPDTRDVRLNAKKLSPAERAAIHCEIEARIKKEQRDWLVRQPPHRLENLPEGSGS